MNTVNVKVEPLWPTETPGALPLASATEPVLDVTVTFTAPPGLTLAAPGLTDVISAAAGPVPMRRIADTATTSTSPRAMRVPV